MSRIVALFQSPYTVAARALCLNLPNLLMVSEIIDLKFSCCWGSLWPLLLLLVLHVQADPTKKRKLKKEFPHCGKNSQLKIKI
jgi:hypothetical protein